MNFYVYSLIYVTVYFLALTLLFESCERNDSTQATAAAATVQPQATVAQAIKQADKK